jgi:hypothetical protein
MSKHVPRLLAVTAAVLLTLALAAPALAGSTTTTHPTTTSTPTSTTLGTTTTTTPTPTPLIVEPRCRPQVNPLAVPPIRPHFKHGGLGPNQDLPEGQPEVDNSLPADQPIVDNSLPGGGLTRQQLRRLLILRRLRARICGETPPIDETRPEITVRPALGEQVHVVRHPTQPWFALINVGTDLAFLENGRDASPEWASAASGIVAGPGVTNSIVIDDRLVAQFSAPIATTTRVNDWFPAGLSSPRENTPNAPGPGGACTSRLAAINLVNNGVFDGRYKLPALNSGSLFNTNTPGGCASAANLVRTPFDDSGAGAGLNRADWTNVGFGFSPAGNVTSQVVARIFWADATSTTVVRQATAVSL